MLNKTILEFNNVCKSYSQKEVLKNITFNVVKNEIIALLGVNGAGKTTMINMMLAEQSPTSGSIELFGLNPKEIHSRNKVGCTPQNIEFPDGIKTKEVLNFIHSHYQNPHTVDFMVETFELSSFLEEKASRLSGGQKRRLALALSFIGNPDIVFLDEPTTGLDVGSRKILWEFIKKEAKSGKTIFLTTHYLEEIEQIASRVIFLQHGQIKIDGTVEDIKKVASSSLVKVSFELSENMTFDNFKYAESFQNVDEKYILETYDPDNLIRELVLQKISFKNLNIERENLESAFLNLSNQS
jgi:ABC-2 type transport system ATP-binding protein